MYVQLSGRAEAPAIVFLHAAGASGWMWKPTAEALSGFYRLTPDLPGHGASADLAWSSVSDTVDALADLIARRVPSGRAHVVGLSLGGHLALSLSRRHPDRVGRVVVSGVSVLPFPRPQLMRALGLLMAALMKRDFFIRAQAKALRIPRAQREEHRRALKAMSPRAFLRIGDELMDYRCGAFAGSVARTLVLAGEQEHPLIRRSMPLILDALPGSQGRLAPAMGHGWIGEAPELFRRTVETWLSDDLLPGELLKP
jgi:pimeloyl-ACP methyl ester carboxylesterase